MEPARKTPNNIAVPVQTDKFFCSRTANVDRLHSPTKSHSLKGELGYESFDGVSDWNGVKGIDSNMFPMARAYSRSEHLRVNPADFDFDNDNHSSCRSLKSLKSFDNGKHVSPLHCKEIEGSFSSFFGSDDQSVSDFEDEWGGLLGTSNHGDCEVDDDDNSDWFGFDGNASLCESMCSQVEIKRLSTAEAGSLFSDETRGKQNHSHQSNTKTSSIPSLLISKDTSSVSSDFDDGIFEKEKNCNHNNNESRAISNIRENRQTSIKSSKTSFKVSGSEPRERNPTCSPSSIDEKRSRRCPGTSLETSGQKQKKLPTPQRSSPKDDKGSRRRNSKDINRQKSLDPGVKLRGGIRGAENQKRIGTERQQESNNRQALNGAQSSHDNRTGEGPSAKVPNRRAKSDTSIFRREKFKNKNSNKDGERSVEQNSNGHQRHRAAIRNSQKRGSRQTSSTNPDGSSNLQRKSDHSSNGARSHENPQRTSNGANYAAANNSGAHVSSRCASMGSASGNNLSGGQSQRQHISDDDFPKRQNSTSSRRSSIGSAHGHVSTNCPSHNNLGYHDEHDGSSRVSVRRGSMGYASDNNRSEGPSQRRHISDDDFLQRQESSSTRRSSIGSVYGHASINGLSQSNLGYHDDRDGSSRVLGRRGSMGSACGNNLSGGLSRQNSTSFRRSSIGSTSGNLSTNGPPQNYPGYHDDRDGSSRVSARRGSTGSSSGDYRSGGPSQKQHISDGNSPQRQTSSSTRRSSIGSSSGHVGTNAPSQNHLGYSDVHDDHSSGKRSGNSTHIQSVHAVSLNRRSSLSSCAGHQTSIQPLKHHSSGDLRSRRNSCATGNSGTQNAQFPSSRRSSIGSTSRNSTNLSSTGMSRRQLLTTGKSTSSSVLTLTRATSRRQIFAASEEGICEGDNQDEKPWERRMRQGSLRH